MKCGQDCRTEPKCWRPGAVLVLLLQSVDQENVLPPRCILNGLHVVSIPEELTQLVCLSSTQLIQRAKCYQTVVRLGTYRGRVPIYNSLKACKGTTFFLLLPLSKTLATLDEVEQSSSAKSALPNPELYIIHVVTGNPTKQKVVWCSLVDVNQVKAAAIQKLKDSNWLYSEVTDESVNKAAKQVVEVTPPVQCWKRLVKITLLGSNLLR